MVGLCMLSHFCLRHRATTWLAAYESMVGPGFPRITTAFSYRNTVRSGTSSNFFFRSIPRRSLLLMCTLLVLSLLTLFSFWCSKIRRVPLRALAANPRPEPNCSIGGGCTPLCDDSPAPAISLLAASFKEAEMSSVDWCLAGPYLYSCLPDYSTACPKNWVDMGGGARIIGDGCFRFSFGSRCVEKVSATLHWLARVGGLSWWFAGACLSSVQTYQQHWCAIVPARVAGLSRILNCSGAPYSQPEARANAKRAVQA
jgi:hypothetical protein